MHYILDEINLKNIILKKITLTIVFVLVSCFSFSQNSKGNFRLEKGSQSHELYLALNKNVDKEILLNDDAFKLLQIEFGLNLEKGIEISDQKLMEMEENAIRLTGNSNSIIALRNILKVAVENPSNERLWELATKLEKLSSVEYCSLMSSEPIKPPSDIPPTTANFEPNQGYIQANPGVNMSYAWGIGQTGTGINIRDVEYGFNKNHEELNDRNVFLGPGMNISSSASVDYTEHGTAVLGIIYADKGTYGISGMAHGASGALLFPEWQQSGYNRVNAVTQAVANSVIGDIIIYEMQTGGGLNNYYVPAEYNQVIWNLTKAATDAGIIVVAAAGNGNNTTIGEDLDAPEYASYMARGDSGAIIVGAGTPSVAHNRLSFSTYGTRVDLQGWGHSVRASGYGDLLKVGGDFNQSYTNFSGTSSATPLVASCAIVLQSYYHSLTGNFMTPQQMRTLMKATGIAQGTGVVGNIGPIPNMETAILQMQNDFLSVSKDNKIDFIAYPNPVHDKLILITQDLSDEARVEVHNAVGQLIYSNKITSESIINLSPFSQGFYFIKVTDNGKSQVKKIVKN